MKPYVEIPFSFSLRDLHKGHQTSLSIRDVGYLGLSNHVVISHHGGERRKTGGKYEEHPFAVAEIVRRVGGSVLDQCKAKLHDILERIIELGDDGLYEKTIQEISKAYPAEVLVAVLALTRFEPDIYHEQLFKANKKDPWIMIIKIADRLHNLVTIRGFALRKQIKYLNETLGSFIDLCNKSRNYIETKFPELLPIYDGMISQLEKTANRKLRAAKKRLKMENN